MPLPPLPTPTTTPSDLHFSLLRIAVIHLLTSSTTLTTARPSVLDALTDLAARHLQLLAKLAVTNAENTNRPEVDIRDVRFALEGAGVLRPTGAFDRDWEDVRGVNGFREWCVKNGARREDGGEVRWLREIMEKGMGEGSSRWKGTVLGEDEGGIVSIPIEGELRLEKKDVVVGKEESKDEKVKKEETEDQDTEMKDGES